MNLLMELNREGTTVVMVTHSEENARMAGRLIRMIDGNILTESRKWKSTFVLTRKSCTFVPSKIKRNMDRIRLKDKEFELFIPEEEIKDAIAKVAERIREDVKGTNAMFVGILNGAFIVILLIKGPVRPVSCVKSCRCRPMWKGGLWSW